MHDDLGAGLSRIKFLSESIRSKKGSDGMIEKDIEKISAYSDEMAEKMGEIVWALNETNDTVADLVAFTRSYANEYLSGQNIHCIFDTPLNLPGTFITGEMRRIFFFL
jgi:signal transduction histidine kinase